MSEFKKDDAYKNLERVNFWIGNCDTKASFILAFNGVVIGLIGFSDLSITTLKKSVQILGDANSLLGCQILSFVFLFSFFAFFLFAIFSIYKLVLALTSKTDSKKFDEEGLNTNSLLHFQSINLMSFLDFEKKLSEQSDDTMLNDINSQVYINSNICTKKFANYKSGIYLLKLALIAISALVLALFILNV